MKLIDIKKIDLSFQKNPYYLLILGLSKAEVNNLIKKLNDMVK